jgi:peptidyl-prolyl cis-trans isomerase B (cyclophilin B)
LSTNRDSRQKPDRDARARDKASQTWATEPNSPRALATAALSVGGSMAAVLLVIVILMSGALEDLFEPPPAASPVPPAVTPIASPPAAPAGDGTTATIETEFGDIVIELFNESSPVAATNFINLAEAGFYDGVIFHRVVPGFVVQGGDPDGDGSGGPGYTIPDEPIVGEYRRGTVAMARRPGVPNSQGSQFFIVLADGAAQSLNGGGYAIFGEVVEGMEVVDDIAAEPRTGERPNEPIEMITVTIQPGEGAD